MTREELLALAESMRQLIATRDAEIALLRASLAESQRRAAALEHQVELLRRSVYGQKSERIVAEQGLLSFSGAPPAPPPPPPPAPPAEEPAPAAGHGRHRLPASLPRERIVHDLPEDERTCKDCGCGLSCIGEDSCELLDYVPSSLRVKELVRKKYACRKCGSHVVTAAPHDQLIDRGRPTAGVIAQVIVSKHEDHLPLNRLERIFARQGVEIARSTLMDWLRWASSMLAPIVAAMKERLLLSRSIHGDDTPVPVLDRLLDKTRTGHLWVYVGDRDHPFRVYDYSPDRRGEHPQAFLAGWAGFFHADAYGGFNALFETGRVHEVACWAHARRKFHEARSADAEAAHGALARIKILYAIEEKARELDDDARGDLRKRESVPILGEFETWLRRIQGSVLPRGPIGEAVGYALRQWAALNRYTEHGFLDIDNNPAERELRAVAVGRKNWEFAGSDEGGRRAAILYSMVASCKALKVEPWAYLRDVLERVGSTPQSRIAELLPDQWSAASTERAAAKT